MVYDNEGILEVTLEAVLGEVCSSLWVRRASGEVYIALKYNVCRLDFIRRRLFMVPLFPSKGGMCQSTREFGRAKMVYVCKAQEWNGRSQGYDLLSENQCWLHRKKF